MTAYYNEWDKHSAAWLRELIKQGLITNGVVDERSITDVQASELAGFTQCHFFAGIGGWSYALRLSNWADNRPVWTASLPCQPFSVAGNQKGKEDERHLLPHFLELVKECRPNTIIGEQVEGAIRHGWLDDLQTTMEAEDYTVGAIVLGAHSVQSPHIRQRLYWVANAQSIGDMREPEKLDSETERQERINLHVGIGSSGLFNGTTDTISTRSQGRLSGRQDSQRQVIDRYSGLGIAIDDRLGNAQLHGHATNTLKRGTSESKAESGLLEPERPSADWSDVEWLYCRDNKYRPILTGLKPVIRTVKSSVSEVVDGLPAGVVHSCDTSKSINANETQEARVMRLKGYGNSIVPAVAAEFIKAFMSIEK